MKCSVYVLFGGCFVFWGFFTLILSTARLCSRDRVTSREKTEGDIVLLGGKEINKALFY